MAFQVAQRQLPGGLVKAAEPWAFPGPGRAPKPRRTGLVLDRPSLVPFSPLGFLEHRGHVRSDGVIDWNSFQRHRYLTVRATVEIDVRSGYDLTTKRADYELKLSFSAGNGEQALDLRHPLVRAFRRALAEGQPPDRWRILICEDDPTLSPRVLGIFTQTRVGRVLFFPAVGTRIGKGFQEASIFEGDPLEHLTLEPNTGGRQSSHLAVTEASKHAKTRGQSFTFTPTHPRDLLYWFSILTPDLDAYPRLPRMLRIRFSSGKLGIKELAPELEARLAVVLVPLPAKPQAPAFVQLDIWSGRSDEQGLRLLEAIPYATHPQIASEAPGAPYSLIAHAAEVPFEENAGLIVMMWTPRGRIEKPMIMRAKKEDW